VAGSNPARDASSRVLGDPPKFLLLLDEMAMFGENLSESSMGASDDALT
jgi:hypothetical protein